MAGICFSIPLSIDPIHDKGCKARSRTLIVDNDFVLMKRFAPLWFRSLWQTNGGISGEGSTVPALLWLRDSKDPFFFVFYLDLEIFFFYKLDGSIVLGWQVQSVNNRVVSFHFDSNRGSRVFSRANAKNCQEIRHWSIFAEGKTAFGFLGETDSSVVIL